jgi:hypothetical protein
MEDSEKSPQKEDFHRHPSVIPKNKNKNSDQSSVNSSTGGEI